MPRKSLKRQVEEELEELCQQRALGKVLRVTLAEDTDSDNQEGQEEEEEDDLEEILDLAVESAYENVTSSRYLFREQTYRKHKPMFQRDLLVQEDKLPWLSDTEFLEKYRMKRENFDALVEKIKGHQVFENKSTKSKQRPVAHQLMVLLNYLGCAGSGASNPRQRQTFGFGRGTSALYRKRCITAIRSLKTQVIHWPCEQEREEIAKRNTINFSMPHCIAVADGTLLPLQSAPQSTDAPDYSGRKVPYSLTVMVVNDDQKRIRYIHAGFPGSVHDSRVYRNTALAKNPNEYFGDKYYLIGDSAFNNSSSVVAKFKAPRGHCLTQEQERFNTHVESLRVTSEHSIGMLKARFPWLRCIPMIITDDPESVKVILRVIEVCVILHNLLLDLHDDDLPQGWYEGWSVVDVIGDPDFDTNLPTNSPGDARRERLLDYLRDYVY